MKLSELTYEALQSAGLSLAHMHTDESDAMTVIASQDGLDLARQELTSRYGDVEITINPDADWFDRIKISDPKWKEDHEKYCRDKAAWCAKYCSD